MHQEGFEPSAPSVAGRSNPLSYKCMVGVAGIEPTTLGLKGRSSTN